MYRVRDGGLRKVLEWALLRLLNKRGVVGPGGWGLK